MKSIITLVNGQKFSIEGTPREISNFVASVRARKRRALSETQYSASQYRNSSFIELDDENFIDPDHVASVKAD